ncbi:MAG TPA: IS630 family transposase [Oculatellaceae cyanobacterium]
MFEVEKSTISLCHCQGKSIRAISQEIGHSTHVISNFLKNPSGYGLKKGGGRPSKLSDKDCCQIIRLAKTGKYSAKDIKLETSLNVSVRTIQVVLQDCKELVYAQKQKAPALSLQHMKARKDWVEQQIDKKTPWSKVIFSDETKFNLDGPDGLRGYWHDHAKEPETHLKRQSGGGSIMVWGAICEKGPNELFFCDEKVNSEYYCKILKQNLLPFAKKHFKRDFIFQHDNAPDHTSNHTKNFLKEKKIAILDWPSKSPDLNPIENLWGIVTRDLYDAGKKQFKSKEEMKGALKKAWKKVDANLCKKSTDTMDKRCFMVYRAKGKEIKY